MELAVTFLFTLIGATVFTFAFRNLIKRHPLVFYGLAVLFDVVFFARSVFPLPALIDRTFLALMQRCLLAEAFFVIVMYVGVFSERSRVRSYLAPIRAELSIIACYLALGHVVAYLGSFGAHVLANGAAYSMNLVVSFCISLVLLALLVLLGVTSFTRLKRRLATRTWKRIQLLAYPFFALTYIHMLLFLLPAALQGAVASSISVICYSVVFVFYAVARIGAAMRRRRSAPVFLRKALP
ncbi:MAG: ferric reductase-like transmembrane domain-containing protein [Coriobacteriales bacterium]|jgi:DMSO/TMAO reductase YedYZ heme-binding membrane subunit|nr:ferric reductase-like transmembrane domain-containing protein [Coriobacteriales bacterium]